MPISPWEEEEEAALLGEQGLVRRDAPELHNVVLRFGVSFAAEQVAQMFGRCFGMTYTRSGVTVRDHTAWLIFMCAATDAQDAALQAAVAVKAVTEDRRRFLVGEQPRESHFHDARVIGPVKSAELVRAHQERDEALARARAWGLMNDGLVQRAQGAPLLPDRRKLPSGTRPSAALPERRRHRF